jgi:cytidylate kinase
MPHCIGQKATQPQQVYDYKIQEHVQEGEQSRCADYILRDFENVVNIFITASIDFRVDIISKVKELDADHTRKLIEHVESRRAQYYNYYTGKKWGAAESYDFCIDASILGVEETEKIIATFIRKRFEL